MRVITARISLYIGDVFLDVARRQRANVPPGSSIHSVLFKRGSSEQFFPNQFTQSVCRRCVAVEHGNRASSSSVASSSVAEEEK